MKRTSVLSRIMGAAMALVAAATPAAAVQPGDPAKRAWAHALKQHLPKTKPRDDEHGVCGRSQRRINPVRQRRRRMEALHRTLMGTRMSGRTWTRFRKAVAHGSTKISRRKSFLFITVLELYQKATLDAARRAFASQPRRAA